MLRKPSCWFLILLSLPMCRQGRWSIKVSIFKNTCKHQDDNHLKPKDNLTSKNSKLRSDMIDSWVILRQTIAFSLSFLVFFKLSDFIDHPYILILRISMKTSISHELIMIDRQFLDLWYKLNLSCQIIYNFTNLYEQNKVWK